MIFIDSNIPMYLIGADHPNKHSTRKHLEAFAEKNESLVTDTEVLQEIMHRYSAINKKDRITPAFDLLYALCDTIFTIEETDIVKAKDSLLDTQTISARDAIHLACMRRHRIRTILSFDRGFDAVCDIRRIPRD